MPRDKLHKSVSVVLCYRIYPVREGWAFIYLDLGMGTVSIHSDWGDWAYSWSKAGLGDRPLASFLCECDNDYLINKFNGGRREYLDFEVTLTQMRQELIRERRSAGLDKDKARRAYDALEDLDHTTDPSDLYRQVAEHGDLCDIYCEYDSVPTVTTWEPGITQFFEKVWPIFKQMVTQSPPTDFGKGEPAIEPVAWLVNMPPGDEFEYKVFGDKCAAEHVAADGDEPTPLYTETVVKGLLLDNDVLKSCCEDHGSPFCEHTERYSYTEDGGKHIVCLLCERKRLTQEATEEYRELICPKCHNEFEDDGKDYASGVFCPLCKGSVRPVIHPRVVKRRITQQQWDEAQATIRDLRTEIQKHGNDAG